MHIWLEYVYCSNILEGEDMKDVIFKFCFAVAVSTVGTVVYIVAKNVVWLLDVIIRVRI